MDPQPESEPVSISPSVTETIQPSEFFSTEFAKMIYANNSTFEHAMQRVLNVLYEKPESKNICNENHH